MKNLARENLVVTATGAISAAELQKILDDVFGGLPAKPASAEISDAKLSGAGKTFLLSVPGPQAQLLMTWPGLKRRDADWYTLEVADYILGGGSFSSRLMKEIREKRGLTYGVNSGASPLDHAALYSIEASFQGKNAAEVVKLVREEVAKMAAAPVTDDELQEAKDHLIGSYPLSLTSTSAIAAHFLSLRLDHLPMDEEEKRAKAIRAVTAQQVQDLVKKMLTAEPTVFFVGNPEGITPTATFDKLD
jgi:zinc protease